MQPNPIAYGPTFTLKLLHRLVNGRFRARHTWLLTGKDGPGGPKKKAGAKEEKWNT